MPKNGMILLAHGSRDSAWMEPFQALAAEVARRSPDTLVRIACLQFCSPDVEAAARALAADGVERITIVPVFFSALGHVLRDVPGAVARARADFPNVPMMVAGTLGEQPEVAEAFVAALLRMVEEA